MGEPTADWPTDEKSLASCEFWLTPYSTRWLDPSRRREHDPPFPVQFRGAAAIGAGNASLEIYPPADWPTDEKSLVSCARVRLVPCSATVTWIWYVLPDAAVIDVVTSYSRWSGDSAEVVV